MKTSTSYSLLAAALACGLAQGQMTAYTTPVGYLSLGSATGDACPAGSEVTASVALNNPALNVLTVASFAADVITVNQTLVAGSYNAPVSGQPYLVQVNTGTRNGVYAVISSNSTNQVTVTPQIPGDLNGLTVGDSITIRLAWTAKSFIPTASVPDGTQVSIFDGAVGIDNSSTVTLEKAGVNWINVTASTLGNDFVLYPGESFLIVNPTATPISSLVVSGEVPVNKSVAILTTSATGAQDTRFAFVSPTSQTIQTAGIPAQDGDQVLVFDNAEVGIDKSAAVTLEKAGVNWINVTASTLGNNFPLTGGQGYVYRRANAGDGQDIQAIATPNYVPTLNQ